MNQSDVSKLLKLATPDLQVHLINKYNYYSFDRQLLDRVLNRIALDSYLDQGIPKPVTSLSYITAGHDLILLTCEYRILAFCKLGVKHLFYYLAAEVCELCALCILDIYVYEQRSGLGSQLIELIERIYGVQFASMAVDNPSKKMQAFLGKKWGPYTLEQNSKFVMRDSAIMQLSESFKRCKFQAARGGRPFPYTQLDIPAYLQFFGGTYPTERVFSCEATAKVLERYCQKAQGDDDGLEQSIVEDYLRMKRRKDEVESVASVASAEQTYRRYIKTGFW